MEWKTIDSAPDGGSFLVFGGTWNGEISDTSDNHIALVEYVAGQFTEVGGDYYSSWIQNPTHWMPLPQPPKVEE